MRKITLLIALILMGVTGGYAQASLYGFAQSSGTYTPITGGTVITSTTDYAVSLDSYASTQLTLPTAFEFAGVSYTTFYATSNGHIGLGNTAPTSYTTASLSSSTGTDVIIAPFSADLAAGLTGLAEMRFQQVGDEIVVQWSNFRRYNRTESFSFQARLNTADKSVKFVYSGNPPFDTSTLYMPQVGIKSTTASYKALTVATGGSWNTPAVITTGISSSSLATFTGTTGFTNGLTYTFTAPPVCTGTPLPGTVAGAATRYVCSGVTPAAISVSNDNTTIGFTYQWQESTNGTDWANATGGTGATTLTYTPPAFAGTNIQYRLKTSCPAGGDAVYSTVVNVLNQIAPATQASALTFSAISLSSVTATWTNGDGGRRLVYASTTPVTDPSSATGVTLTANALFANAGQQLIYDGTGTSVTVTGLACNAKIYITVYEYNRCGAGPYDIYVNTTSTGTNAGNAMTTSPETAVLPVANAFTGFTGSNLSTAVPGWYEAAIATTAGAVPTTANPTGTASIWSNSTVFTQTTAKINLYTNTANAWIVSPKMAITEASRLRFKAAITEYAGSTADPARMQGTDDKVNILVSTDGCGAVWTPIFTFDASNTTALTNALTDYNVLLTGYTGQTIQIAFQATDGPVNDDPDYDFHIGSVVIEAVPACEGPLNVLADNNNFTTATVNWTAPATAPANGYEYYYSTSATAPVAGTTVNGTVGAGVTTVNLTGLTASSTYYVWVRSACDATSKSAWVAASSFFTGYCTPAPESVDEDGITNVTIGTINNTTEAETGNYGNYTNMSTSVAAGSTVPFAITYNTGYTYGTKIWVDWNNDADFDDAGELVYTGISTNAMPTVLSGTFAVPSAASVVGSHVMRIGGTDADAGGTPCYDDTYGSYEDYTLNVFMPDAPVITGFTPASYCAVNGVITITGTNLGFATLAIGGTAVTTTTNTATQIVATVPAGVSGTVSVTTAGGTATSTDTFAVNTPAPVVLSGTTTTTCAGVATDLVTLTSGADVYDTYVWSPATGITGNAQDGFIFTASQTTTYTLSASQSNGPCAITAQYTVVVNPLPAAVVVAATGSTVCSDVIVPLIATGGTSGGLVTLGTATTLTTDTEQPTAFNNRWPNYWVQTIYTAAELNAAGLVAGNISSIAYNVATLGSAATNANFTVKIGTTTLSAFADTNYLSTTGYTTVYGPSTYTHTATGWQTITFAAPYVWDGVSNIVVNVTMDGADSSNNTQTYYTATTASTVLWRNSYSATTTTGNTSLKRPNTRFNNLSINPITWSPATNLYTDAAATTPYVAGAAATTVYFKSNTAGTAAYTATATAATGCINTAAVSVTVNVTSEPSTVAAQTFCPGATVADIEAEGTALAYYTAATGGTALAATTALANGTYYVSQTVNNCESTRVAIAVNINVVAGPTVAEEAISVCNEGTVADLVALGTAVQWYAAATGGEPLATTTAFTEGTTTYYASQTVDGCESPVRTALAVTLNITDAPVAAATQTFCNQGVIGGLEADGADVKWYENATGGEALEDDVILTDGTVYYAGATENGCDSATRTAVTVVINTVAVPDVTDVFECVSYTLPQLTSGAYFTEQGGTGDTLAAGTVITENTTVYIYAAVGTCTDETSFDIVIGNTPAPEAVSPQVVTVLEGPATIEDIVVDANEEGTVTWYATEADAQAAVNPLAAGTEITAGSTYYATQTIGECTSVAVLSVTVSEVLGTKGFDAASFSYYPNPVSNVLNIKYSSDITSVEVFNLLGQKVVTVQPHATNATVDMSALAEGTYMVTVKTGAATKTFKVVKKLQ